MSTSIGTSTPRVESWQKVTGQAKYVDDLPAAGILAARILASTRAHARIVLIDKGPAERLPGVKAVITGRDVPLLCGALLGDRPALAVDKARYAGEPVALVVATDEAIARAAVLLIRVVYEDLPAVLNPRDALSDGAPILHEHIEQYARQVADVYPQPGKNIASLYRIRKGDMEAGWDDCAHIVARRFDLPPSDHLAMEVRSARAEILSDGSVRIDTSSQAPYAVKEQLVRYFALPAGKVAVHVPLVGGGFGGKAPAMLEILAYIASTRVGGRPVKLIFSREEDMQSAPCRLGLSADVKLGADKGGKLKAAEFCYLLDCGAYSDSAPYMAKAMAADCTGPYRIDNLACDAYCVYTNHTYATSYRGFGHLSYTFCVERAMDALAGQLRIDPVEFRLINAIRPGDLSPTQVVCTLSNTGNLGACLSGLKQLSRWNGGAPVKTGDHTVRAQGVACLWKSATPPTDAPSGALLTFNEDGSINLNTGVVEMGNGSQTDLAKMVAEAFQMDVGRVHPVLCVDTRLNPKHWKTVASLTGYMAGNAVMRAADDALRQLRALCAQALSAAPDEIEISGGQAFLRLKPDQYIELKDLVFGYAAPDGSSIGDPVLGRGAFMLKGLGPMDPKTGQGKTGPDWTVGAQAVEVELDTREYTYRIVSASTVIDVGRLINPDAMREMIAGGMAMGVSMSSREAFYYQDGHLAAPNLRTYKLLHIGQEPDYRVAFIETPQQDSPFGVRSFSEHGIIGIPAALAGALSAAAGADFDFLPLSPEKLWKTCKGGNA